MSRVRRKYDFVTRYYEEDVYKMCLDYREELQEMFRWANEYREKYGVDVRNTKEFSKIVFSLTREIEEETDFV